jgi:hypothetical protein
MAEKLLLHIQYECNRFKIDLPWENIAHRLHPGTSGGAIVQHLARMRGTLVAEGHLVPPIMQKPGSRVQVDPNVRGYARRFMTGADTVTTRPVTFQEEFDDAKFNLPDAVDARQSAAKMRATQSAAIPSYTPDPNDLDGDDDYEPSIKHRRSTRAKKQTKYVEPEALSDGEEETGEGEVAAPAVVEYGDEPDREGTEVEYPDQDDIPDEDNDVTDDDEQADENVDEEFGSHQRQWPRDAFFGAQEALPTQDGTTIKPESHSPRMR